MPALPSVSSYAASPYAPYTPSSTAQASSLFLSPIGSVHLAAFADEFDSARVLRAVAEPRPREQCHTVLPQASPVEVQVEGRTVMHLHSEPDRVAFLNENRVSAVWIEMLGAARAVAGCPTDVRPGQVGADVADRMSCLGVGAGELRRADAPPLSNADAVDALDADRVRDVALPVDTSEFATVEALSLPSVYLREPGFEPGTMAALEYDLGWRALAPSWRSVMPSVDEGVWASDPNTQLFCAVGRAVLPHLATYESGQLVDEICARIVSFHMHAGGLVDCLANVTQTVERMSADGQPTSVSAIEIADFMRECAGADWRDSIIGKEGEDALTRRRQACSETSTLASTSAASPASAAVCASSVPVADSEDRDADDESASSQRVRRSRASL
ncbi:hypothetical protein [Pandoraea anhela]|uniref:Uncharacterized protein n=1 Tax=Pandoraea anhela TaxID=2508295 RepID=A0A5E4TYT0_9BURK|nr:hypothetical protein [Pandoraea anhela]VVD92392.1 hypothetical protein PAN31108_01687 [Pandoraea anhela]